MGLSLTQNTESGAQVTYWHIAKTTVDYEARTMIVRMSGFLSEALRMGGATPAVSVDLSIDPVPASVERDDLYPLIKATPQFATASDA